MTSHSENAESTRNRSDLIKTDQVRLAQNGDLSAREDLFATHWSVCFRVARRMTGSDQDAEDVVQDAYVKALRNLSRFDHRCAFRTWLLRIVTNCATDHLRRNRRRGILFDVAAWARGESRFGNEIAETSDPSLPLQNSELRKDLDSALSQLSQTTRGAFVLYAEAEMTYQEVADTLSVPLGTVMSRIHSARKKLKIVAKDLDNRHDGRESSESEGRFGNERNDSKEIRRSDMHANGPVAPEILGMTMP